MFCSEKDVWKKNTSNGELFAAEVGKRLENWKTKVPETHVDQLINAAKSEKQSIEQLNHISSGDAGGNIYLVNAHLGKNAFVVKIYKDSDFFENDVLAFSRLSEILNQNSDIPLFIPKHTIVQELVIALEYIPGRTVYETLEKMKGSDQKTILFNYESGLEKLSEAAARQHDFVESNQGFGSMTFKTFQLYLHSENVLVHNKTGELWIIDPY